LLEIFKKFDSQFVSSKFSKFFFLIYTFVLAMVDYGIY